jgi:hypothetical protein
VAAFLLTSVPDLHCALPKGSSGTGSEQQFKLYELLWNNGNYANDLPEMSIM